MNDHWNVLYQVSVFYADRKSKMATTAGPRLTLDPMGKSMIIPLQFGFSQFISFREEDLWNFSQSEHIIGPGSHVVYLTGTFLVEIWCSAKHVAVSIAMLIDFLLVHLDQRSMWTIAITWRPSSVNFSHFKLLMFLLSGSMHLSLEVLLTVGADEEVSLTETERIQLLADYIQETEHFDL
jgi:hypothetical protein